MIESDIDIDIDIDIDESERTKFLELLIAFICSESE